MKTIVEKSMEEAFEKIIPEVRLWRRSDWPIRGKDESDKHFFDEI